MNEVMQGIRGIKDTVIKDDINIYMGSYKTDYDRVYEEYGFGEI